MKKRLLVLSDLWGSEKGQWLDNYTQKLKADFEIVQYDSCELGGIDKSDFKEEALHKQFVNGGVERALVKLMELENAPLDVLAFSIGGTIAWKFALKNELVASLTCVSSTRLRYETNKPSGDIHLYFGEKDAHKPKIEWFEKMNVAYEIDKDQGHEMYREPMFAQKVSEKLKRVLI